LVIVPLITSWCQFHNRVASATSVIPRFGVRLGYFVTLPSLCVKSLMPPSRTSSTSVSADHPESSEKWSTWVSLIATTKLHLGEGIARQASPTAGVSTSNTLPHCGQLVFIAAVPLPFIS